MSFHIAGPGGGTTFARGSVSGVKGAPALGFFRLTVNVELVIQPAGAATAQADAPQITAFAAEIGAGGKLLGRFRPAMQVLPLMQYAGSANTQSVPLECDLDRARIEAVEGLRAGGHLDLQLYMTARFGNGQATSLQDTYHVNQGVWVAALDEMGYQRSLLIEVPVPDASRHPELAAAVDSLAQAQAHMLNGQDRDAVGACRDVLEELSRALGDDDDDIDPEVKRVLFNGTRRMTKAERMRVVRRALKIVTHPARHRDNVAVGIDWSRIDSAAVIQMTAALINEMDAPGARPETPSESPADS